MASSVVNKLNLFLKNIYLDYYEVFKDLKKSARARPIRASIYGGFLLFSLNTFRTNEGLRSYNSEVISACNRLGAVAESSRNPKSSEFVQVVGELNGQNLLRQIDLGFSTIIYRAECNPGVALFRYNCSHLRPSISEFVRERLVDWGFLGHWLLLELRMRDYDVNDEEVLENR